MHHSASVAAAVFAALFVAHSVGDHWVQTHTQALTKGERSRAGRSACARHVLSLTATKVIVLLATAAVLHLPLSSWGIVTGLTVDALSHYWADRRYTLAKLAHWLRNGEFLSLGTGDHPHHPVTADGKPAATLGTGAYALDQSWHLLWLWVATLIIAAV